MGTTAFPPRLGADLGALDPAGGRSAPAAAGSAVAAPGGSFTATAPFTTAAADPAGVAPWRARRTLTTTLGTLAWLPALVLTVVTFALVGAVAGIAAFAVWAWRSLSPASSHPGVGVSSAEPVCGEASAGRVRSARR